jgi:hypothetical protein
VHYDTGCLCVNNVHHPDSMTPFVQARLVYADGVDPKYAGTVGRANMIEKIVAVCSDFEQILTTIHVDTVNSGVLAPCVRYGFIGRAFGKSRVQEITDDRRRRIGSWK